MAIGGTITFTINGAEYQAEGGMTWGEWCNSRYNTSEFVNEDGYIYDKDYTYALCLNEDMKMVQSSDIIITNYSYYLL